ncbi:MAG: methionine synthase, partial [Chloroflexi bacterium]|nr:methionine synthase [Chloroflexota bacterium]
TDASGRGILYDELLADAAAKFLRLKAMWQERFLLAITEDTLIFLDEPYLASLGSAFVSISNEQVTALIEEVLGGLQGIKGIHCCGGADWTLLLKSSIDILSFDAYNYAESLACYPAEVNAFIKRGGALAWGIVPNDEDILKKESLSSLSGRLEEVVAVFSRDGISFREIILRSLITPTCGLASLSPDTTEEVFRLLVGLSEYFRTKYIA